MADEFTLRPEAVMDELREMHLGIPRPEGTGSVFAELQATYEEAGAQSAP